MQRYLMHDRRLPTLELLPLPRAADVIDAELHRVARPHRRRAEGAAVRTCAWVVALHLVINSRNARAGHAPTPVGLQVGRRRHDHGYRHAVRRVGVVAVPVVPTGAMDGQHVTTIAQTTIATAVLAVADAAADIGRGPRRGLGPRGHRNHGGK